MSRDDDESGLSIATVSLGVGVVVAFLLWGVACAMYDAARPQLADVAEVNSDFEAPRIRVRGGGAGLVFAVAGVVTFVVKSFTMLPELPGVVGFVFRERMWFAMTAALVLGGVVLFGVFLKRTEAALAAPRHRRKRRR